MKKRVKIFLVLILICCLLLGTSAIYAETYMNRLSDVQDVIANQSIINDTEKLINHNFVPQRKLVKDDKKTISSIMSVAKEVQAADTVAVNPRVNISGTLTTESAINIYFFNASEDKFMVAELASNNADYAVQLYVVDYDAGTMTPTNIANTANNLIALNGLPAGDYALVIGSNNLVGDNYTLKLNAANPAGDYTSILKITPSLLQFVIQYTNGDVYANGTYVFNPSGSTEHLDWNRDYMFTYSGNYIHREHDISSVVVKSISGPVSYSSSYASSNNAMLIYLDVETLFMYFYSEFTSVPSHHYYTFIDTLGKKTPRRLEADDYNYGDHILVYDLDTGKSIDFFSVLNYYYASGAEPIPTITFLN